MSLEFLDEQPAGETRKASGGGSQFRSRLSEQGTRKKALKAANRADHQTAGTFKKQTATYDPAVLARMKKIAKAEGVTFFGLMRYAVNFFLKAYEADPSVLEKKPKGYSLDG